MQDKIDIDTLITIAEEELANLDAKRDRLLKQIETLPIQAYLARKLGSFLVTETMEHRPEIGFKSYDRFFPSQDTLPQGGFGNLIALPLQKVPSEKGNSLFVDRNFIPYADQWAYLASIRRMSYKEVEKID